MLRVKGKHKDLKEFLKIIHEQNENIKRYSNCKKNNCEILYEMKNLLESGNSRHVLLQKKSTNHKEGSKGEDEEQKVPHSFKKYHYIHTKSIKIVRHILLY